ncbi:MAG: copper resistance CopC/CopD family protein [Gemmatimonadaceae bacterium]
MPVLLFRPRRRLLPALLLLLLAGLPARLQAHARLLSSTPAAGDTLRQSPAAIHLVFSERPELRFTTVRLLDADGREVQLAQPAMAIEGSEAGVLVAIREVLPAGTYRVEWQTGSADGHPIKGRFSFTVVAAATPAAPGASGAPGAATDTSSTLPSIANPVIAAPSAPLSFPDSSHLAHPDEREGAAIEQPIGFRLARWIEFMALLVMAGTVVFGRFVLPAVADDGALTADAWRRARGAGLLAAAVLVLAALARLYAQGIAMHGPGGGLEPVMLTDMVGGTRWGLGWGLGVAGALLVIVALALRRGDSRHAFALVGALAACVSPAFTGHAAATEGGRHVPAVLFDVLHVTGAAAWLGTLTIMAAAAIPAAMTRPKEARGPAVARLFHAFHPVGLVAVGMVLLSGIGSSWIRLGSLAQLTMSNYGSVLLFKIYMFVLVGMLGAYNWKKVLPRLGDDAGTHRIRRTVAVELVIGMVVLGLTALLVITNPPR